MTSSRLTIFEGPDGSGKTTLAQKFAKDTGATYFHFGPMLGVKRDLAHFFVEAMQPALLGLSDVVLDRSWYSEMPYGGAYRNGVLRVDRVDSRMLERIARRCAAAIVLCYPPFKTCRDNWAENITQQYVKEQKPFRQVYDLYAMQQYDLPIRWFDYTSESYLDIIELDKLRSLAHPVFRNTAGNLCGSIVIVGEGFANHRDPDNVLQHPFVSFSHDGCSRWITQQLLTAGISEKQILWVNADQWGSELNMPHVIALGDYAAVMLAKHNTPNLVTVPHPQYWKRFRTNEPYPLISALQSIF